MRSTQVNGRCSGVDNRIRCEGSPLAPEKSGRAGMRRRLLGTVPRLSLPRTRSSRYFASAACILCITAAKWASRAANSSLGLNITNSEPAKAFGEWPGVM